MLAADGSTAAAWEIGELPGLDRDPVRVAVLAGGPATLPSRRTRPARVVEGRIEFFKSGEPVAGVRLTACDKAFRDRACKGAPRSYMTTTDASGKFTFRNVEIGSMVLVVQPLPDEEQCDGPFTPEPFFFDGSDCPGSGRCDLGILEHCVMFEMPSR